MGYSFALALIVFAQNNSLSFDSDADVVTMGTDEAHALRGDITLEAWIKINQYPDATPFPFAHIVNHSNEGDGEAENALYTLAITDTGLLDAFHENGAGINNGVFSTTVLPLDTWIHVAQIRDASAQTYQFVINGIAEDPVSYPDNPTGGENTVLRIGSTDSSGPLFFDGLIDEVRIWDRQLSLQEIRDGMFTQLDPGQESGLVGYWQFDEGVGSTLGEISGNGFDGTITGALWSDEGSPIIEETFSLNFDSEDDVVTVGTDEAHALRGDITLEAWIKINQYPDATPFPFAHIINHADVGDGEAENALYTLAITDTGLLDAFHENGAGINNGVFSTTVLPLDTWIHVAQIRDASAQTYQFVINGIAEDPVSYPDNPTGGENTVLRIGNSDAINPLFFDGLVDEVRIWDRQLSLQEIRDGQFIQLDPAEQAGLVGYWRLDEGVGIVVSDLSGNGFDGVLENALWDTESHPVFDQNATASEVVLPADPIEIPASGGEFVVEYELSNETENAQSFDVWTNVVLPDGEAVDRKGPRTANLNAGQSINPNIKERFAEQMDAGEYQYNILTGTYPNNVVSVAGFNFSVTDDPSEANAALVGEKGNRTDLIQSAAVPKSFLLNPNYPNPFNPGTTINFGLPESAEVRLAVYDMLGRQVDMLVDGIIEAGMHEVHFDAFHLPSGAYIYKLETPAGSFVNTMLLLK